MTESQIGFVEETIKLKKKLGKDASFEEKLVKSWKRYVNAPRCSRNALRDKS